MDIELRPNRGMIIGICAGSKVGKTLISINIALRAKIPTVIFSYEMSKLTLLEQFSKMLNLNPLDPMDAKAFVEVGDVIQKGSVICIIEAMKVMNEIESEHAGRIIAIPLENSTPVEYGEPICIIDPFV